LAGDVAMNVITVPNGSGLCITCSIHEAPNPQSHKLVVLHHGICHTREHFLELIAALNERGIPVAMIDQQSEGAQHRNRIGVKDYVEGLKRAVERLQQDGWQIGSYALHSMGALVGEHLQKQNPELRKPTVLMAPIPRGGAWPITWRIIKRRTRDYGRALRTLDIRSLADTVEHVKELFFDPSVCDDIVERTRRRLKHVSFWVYCELVLRWLLWRWIRDDGQPKLLLRSKTDEIFHPPQYKYLEDLYDTFIISGGHDFFIVHPNATAKLIADFHLKLCGGLPPGP
jgi:pimeloyl-ACP methyl ester carboxylesterase